MNNFLDFKHTTNKNLKKESIIWLEEKIKNSKKLKQRIALIKHLTRCKTAIHQIKDVNSKKKEVQTSFIVSCETLKPTKNKLIK